MFRYALVNWNNDTINYNMQEKSHSVQLLRVLDLLNRADSDNQTSLWSSILTIFDVGLLNGVWQLWSSLWHDEGEICRLVTTPTAGQQCYNNTNSSTIVERCWKSKFSLYLCALERVRAKWTQVSNNSLWTQHNSLYIYSSITHYCKKIAYN